jgi:hypothetical protein
MPLSAAYPLLIIEIEAAFKEKQQSYEKSDASKKMTTAEREAIDLKFYTALATAIHSYTMSAVVSTSTVAGIVGTAAPIILGVPAAPVFGGAVGVGTGILL